jgi:1,4-dihydroxy-2-naphthoate octaprenyltransferase
MLKMWIEAMRLRTLPVSVAGVLAGIACAIMGGTFSLVPAVLCLLFAMLAQVASNFGNEYYDYVNGLDRKGREGFRRGVTEGDISPRAMKIATYATLAVAAVVGCSMLFFGGWWLLPVGIAIGLFALAYSAGPYPLSHHGLGDVAVVVFFGIVPVTLTCYLQEGGWRSLSLSLPVSVAVGLLAANVLVVNNYRDVEDDRAVGKRTTVVIFGRKIMERCYLLSGFVAMLVMIPVWVKLSVFSLVVPATFLFLHVKTWKKIISSRGAALNPLLGATAKNLLLFTLLLFACSLMRSFF